MSGDGGMVGGLPVDSGAALVIVNETEGEEELHEQNTSESPDFDLGLLAMSWRVQRRHCIDPIGGAGVEDAARKMPL